MDVVRKVYPVVDGIVVVPGKAHLLSFCMPRLPPTDYLDATTFWADGTWRHNSWYAWVGDGRWEMRDDGLYVSYFNDNNMCKHRGESAGDLSNYDNLYQEMQEHFFCALVDDVLKT